VAEAPATQDSVFIPPHQGLDMDHPNPTETDQVLRVAAEWDRELISNDPARLERYMTPAWVYLGPTGPVTRSEILGWIADGRLAHHSMKAISDIETRAVGDAIVVTARKQSTGAWHGTPYQADEWITQLYVRTSTGWSCAFSQKTAAG
jgi:hypothetical protein